MAKPKDVYSLTTEERKKVVETSVMSHFHPPPPPPKHVVPEDAVSFFTKMAKVKQMGADSIKPLTDYECINKKQAKSKSGPIIKDAPSIADFLAE